MNPTSPAVPRLAALLYRERGSGDTILRDLAARLTAEGLSVAGMVQIDPPRADRPCCDMVMEDLSSGLRIPISQDLGAEAQGCRLDPAALTEAAQVAVAGLSANDDLVILSKFGRREAEGHGFRAVIEAAVALDVPVLVGVAEEHLPDWTAYADGFGTVLSGATDALAWARRVTRGSVEAVA